MSAVGQKRSRELGPSYSSDGVHNSAAETLGPEDYDDFRLDLPQPSLRTEFVDASRNLARSLSTAAASASPASLESASSSHSSAGKDHRVAALTLPPAVGALLELGLGRGAPSRLFDWLPDVQAEISSDLRKFTLRALSDIASAPRVCASSVRSRGCAALGATLALLMPLSRRAVLAYLAAVQDAGLVDEEHADAAMALLQRAEHFPALDPLLDSTEWKSGRSRATAAAAEAVNTAAGAAERVALTVCAWSCLLRDSVAAADMAEAWARDFDDQAEAQRLGVDALAAAWDEETAQLRAFDRELEGIATGQLLQRGRALPSADGGAAGAAAAGGARDARGGSSRSRGAGKHEGDASDDDDGASGSFDGDRDDDDHDDGNVAFEAGDVVSTVLDLLHSPRPELAALTARRAECAKRRTQVEATGLALKVEARISTSLAALCRAITDAIEATALDVMQELQGTLLRRAVAADAATARAVAAIVSAHEAEAARGDAADSAVRALRARLADNDAFFRSGAAPVMLMTLQSQLEDEEGASRSAADAQLFLSMLLGSLGSYLAAMPLELRETTAARVSRLLRASSDAASSALGGSSGSGSAYGYHHSSFSDSYGGASSAASAAAATASALASAFSKSGLRNRLSLSLQQARRNADSMRSGGAGAADAAGAGGMPGPLQHVQLLLEQALPAAQLALDKSVGGAAGSSGADSDLLARVDSIRLPLAPALASRLGGLVQSLERGAAAAHPIREDALLFSAGAAGGAGAGSSGAASGPGSGPGQSPVLLSLSMISTYAGSAAEPASGTAESGAAEAARGAGAVSGSAGAASAGHALHRPCGLRPVMLDGAVVTLRVLAATQKAWLAAPGTGAASGAGRPSAGAGAGSGPSFSSSSSSSSSVSGASSASSDDFWRSALARLPSAADVIWAHDAAAAAAAGAMDRESRALSSAGSDAASASASRPLLSSCRSLFDAHALMGPYVPADFASYRRRRSSSSGSGSAGSKAAAGTDSDAAAPSRSTSSSSRDARAQSQGGGRSAAAAASAGNKDARPAKRTRRDEEEQGEDSEESGSGGDDDEGTSEKDSGKSGSFCIIM